MPTPEPDSFRLIHLSDPHLTSLAHVRCHELLNKRLLGWLSWKLKRRHVHRLEVLETLQQDLQQHRADHITVTGDLTQLGTVSECRQAKAWLEQLGPPADVTVIPGNHDRYAPARWSTTLGQWTDYMHGDADTPGFPALRNRGQIALIGLSTAVPTAPFLAGGRLGEQQRRKLGQCLEQAAVEDRFRILLLHHGPVPGTYTRRRSLSDDRQFCDLVKQKGAELILHGHGHRHITQSIQTAACDIPVLGSASASYHTRVPEKRAAYNICDIAAANTGWRLTVTPRLYDIDTNTFRDGEIRVFDLPAANRPME